MIARAFRRIFQKLLHLRFLVFQRHRHNRLVLETVCGKPFVVLPGVFNPTLFFSSTFFIETFSRETIPVNASVLDLGTGSGVCAVFAAALARKVIAVDINPEAARCARINSVLNKLEPKIEVREGDLFAPVRGEVFDIVLFNPPYLAGNPKNALDKAFYSDTITASFAENLGAHLSPGGCSLVVLSDIGNETQFITACRENGFTEDIIARRRLPGETLRIYRLKLREG